VTRPSAAEPLDLPRGADKLRPEVLSAVTSGVEAVLFAVGFTWLIANLGGPVRLLGYALGAGNGRLVMSVTRV
jgi:hypothetical protein